MTNADSVSYLIIALHRLGYPYEEIRKIRKEFEVLLDLHTKEDIEMQAAKLLAKLIKEGIQTVRL